jgi:hypothetical protein
MSTKCKVKIGLAYEPKWFERRATQGTYSAKNIPLDIDQMWLQNALLGDRVPTYWKTKIALSILLMIIFACIGAKYGVFK